MSHHPTVHDLTAWLDGGAPTLDEHLAGCEVCAARLAETPSPDVELSEPLRVALAPAVGSEQRVGARVAARLQNRRDVELALSMLGVPFETLRVITDPLPPTTELE